LRVVGIGIFAGIRGFASSGAVVSSSTALTIVRLGGARSSGRRGHRRRIRCRGNASSGGGGRGRGDGGRATRSVELVLDECECCLAIHVTIALMRVGVVSVAAVRVRCVTIGLNFGSRWALEASWTGCELKGVSRVNIGVVKQGT